MIEKTQDINQLLDFYSVLLTSKQLEIMSYYYFDDYSLSEISELLNISRSAVYDTIKKSTKNIESYEEKLRLYEKFKKRCIIYEELKEIKDPKVSKLVEKCYKTE